MSISRAASNAVSPSAAALTSTVEAVLDILDILEALGDPLPSQAILLQVQREVELLARPPELADAQVVLRPRQVHLADVARQALQFGELVPHVQVVGALAAVLLQHPRGLGGV